MTFQTFDNAGPETTALIDGRAGGATAPVAGRTADVIVVGAGLAGTAAATALARAGRGVVLIDAAATVPPTLRAEKLDAPIMELFARIGLDGVVRSAATPINSVWVARFGKLMSRRFKREYGFSYRDLVTTLRASLPREVDFRIGRIAEIENGPDRQRVTLGDGSELTARLLVVATGPGDAVRELGIRVVEAQEDHSMCIGFFLKTPRGELPFESLIYQGECREDRVAYLSLFPIGARMRANLFVYHNIVDDWTRRFRTNPTQTLRETLPNLESLRGPLEVDDPVEIRPIDLRVVTGHESCDGVVLIGDAFCTSCPITGTGMRKALIDVDRLCHEHVPGWFETPGMGARKIAHFYADEEKTRFDADSLHASNDLRGLKIGEGRHWIMRRLKHGLRNRITFQLQRSAHRAASVFGTFLSAL